MFDARRQVILLVGGDKSGEWSEWYDWAVRAADDLRLISPSTCSRPRSGVVTPSSVESG